MAYRNILLAYDGSRDGHRVLSEGAEVAKNLGAKIHLLAVITTKSGALFAPSLVSASPIEHTQIIRDTLAEGIRFFRQCGIEVEGHVVRGDPCAEIARLAQELRTDLVVVGHRPHGPLARWWTTPTCMSLLDRLECSVLVCRQEDEAAAKAS